MSEPQVRPPAYEDVLETYHLDMLKGGADLSVTDTGDIASTKDGDRKLGDSAHNALFRLVQGWRYKAPHLRYLFDLIPVMKAREAALTAKRDNAAAATSASFEPEAIAAFQQIGDEQGAAGHGASTYAGCVVLLLSGALLRFKDDAEATADEWNKSAPLFNGCSFGQVIVAAANGVRHDDEWAKTRTATAQQKVSQEILAKALAATLINRRLAPGLAVEVIDMLGVGGSFEKLSENLFAFAHNVAMRRRARA
jgi:hypothetical protein